MTHELKKYIKKYLENIFIVISLSCEFLILNFL